MSKFPDILLYYVFWWLRAWHTKTAAVGLQNCCCEFQETDAHAPPPIRGWRLIHLLVSLRRKWRLRLSKLGHTNFSSLNLVECFLLEPSCHAGRGPQRCSSWQLQPSSQLKAMCVDHRDVEAQMTLQVTVAPARRTTQLSPVQPTELWVIINWWLL